jgi:hypothetical protein
MLNGNKFFTKICNIIFLLHGCAYVEMNKICLSFLDFSSNYYAFFNFQPF